MLSLKLAYKFRIKSMGGLGSGKGTRRNAWRSKKRFVSSLPELVIPDLIYMHKTNPDNKFLFNQVKLRVEQSSIFLEHAESKSLEVSEFKISLVPCNYGGYRYYGLCPFCQKRVQRQSGWHLDDNQVGTSITYLTTMMMAPPSPS